MITSHATHPCPLLGPMREEPIIPCHRSVFHRELCIKWQLYDSCMQWIEKQARVPAAAAAVQGEQSGNQQYNQRGHKCQK